MPTIKTEIRSGVYYDLAKLMMLQRSLAELPSVEDTGMVMGTHSNKELLAHIGLDTPEVRAAKSDELVIVVKAENDKPASDALAKVDELLAARKSQGGEEHRPRSIESAAETLPESGWVIVSVAGRYATTVTRECLRLGKHVHLFSDNVSVENEIVLKKEARDLGLLVMGPDCGTAIVDGMGMAFANKVRKVFEKGITPRVNTGVAHKDAGVGQVGAGVVSAPMKVFEDALIAFADKYGYN